MPPHARGVSAEHTVFHWLTFQRQGRFPCSVPLVLRTLLHIFPTQNQHFSSGGPILALKRNVNKTPLLVPNINFSNEKSTCLMQNQHFSNGRSWGGLGRSWGGLGRSRGGLGAVLGDLGSVLGGLRAVLDGLGRSWVNLGRSGGGCLRRCGGSFGVL